MQATLKKHFLMPNYQNYKRKYVHKYILNHIPNMIYSHRLNLVNSTVG